MDDIARHEIILGAGVRFCPLSGVRGWDADGRYVCTADVHDFRLTGNKGLQSRTSESSISCQIKSELL